VDLAVQFREELVIVGATVINLESHPRWIAARRRERLRQEAMRRHPACVGRPRTGASNQGAAQSIGGTGNRNFMMYRSSDEPA
jgi:hypothetical protein